MAKGKAKNESLFATGGGNATAAGVSMQVSVAASFAVQIITPSILDARLELGAAKPVSLRMESDAPVDDIVVETDQAGWVFIQSKNRLSGSTKLDSELGKTCDEFARLWRLTVSGDGARGWNRPLKNDRDAMVIAVGPTTSVTYKTDLPIALNALRMGSIDTLNDAQQAVLTSFSGLLRQAFNSHNALATLDLNDVMKFIHVMNFDFGGPSRDSAETRLAALLEEPENASAAFQVIERKCQAIMAARGRVDGTGIRIALTAANVPIKTGSPTQREQLTGIEITNQKILAAQKDMARALSGPSAQNTIVTREAFRRLSKLKRARFTIGFESKPACMELRREAESGELTTASPAMRQSIFAWCARILVSVDFPEAERSLAMAEEYGTSDEITIARAFLRLYAPNGDKSAALSMLAHLDTQQSLAASLFIAAHGLPPEDALKWLRSAGISLDRLHPDGKFRVISLQLTAGDWSSAFETASALSETDFNETPALLFLAAAAYLGNAVHPEFREVLQLPLPQDLAGFPLGEDASAMECRTKAIEFYKRSAVILTSLEADKAAAFASDRALWLELRDPSSHAAALKELQDSMADEKVRLRRLPLAADFGLPLNEEAIESDIERAMALSGGTSVDASVARLMMALRKKAPEVANYIEAHRAELIEYYQPAFIVSIEIEALARAGRTTDARAKLVDIESEVEPHIVETLKNIIEESEGADPVAGRESEYSAQKTVSALIKLVDELKRTRDFPRLAQYGEKLFAALKDGASAEIYVSALYEIEADEKIVEFAEGNPAIVRASGNIGTAVSWSYFRLGHLADAKAMLDALRSSRDVQNDRYLSMNIAIASGDWSSLNSFVESEWAKRDEREPVELLRAGILAQRLGAGPRSQELVREAAKKADKDPNVLVQAYDIASSSGWENDGDIHGWLATAIETSGEDGPIKRVDIREIIDGQPRWNERVDRSWDMLVRGETPMFLAAQATRRTLLDLTLRPALQNLKEADPRKRPLIFAYAGNRPIRRVGGKRLALDITSILSFAVTGVLQRVLDWSDSVFISHTTLSWLFEERAKLAFHQPSQVQRAQEIKNLIDDGQLHIFEGGAPPPAIEHEVGDEIAKYLIAAQTVDSEDASQKIVICPYPLHRPGSLLEEKADVSGFESHFAGCTDLIEVLRTTGVLTEVERTNALSFLQLHETPWPHTPRIQPGSTLYLDDLTVSYLQQLKLLPRLAKAGFKAFITSSEAQQADALTNFDESGAEARVTVETVQNILRDGIASGKVVLGRQMPGDVNDNYDLNPSRLMIAQTPDVDAVVVDDRFVNKYPTTNTAPTATSVDVLTTMAGDGALSEHDLTEAITCLRWAGLAFVPHCAGEISTLLNAAPVVDSRVRETAELRAIRESITRVRMTDALQLPAESEWLDTLIKELLTALRAQWNDEIPEVEARARSNWVLKLLDPRGWAHIAVHMATDSTDRHRAQVMALMIFPSATEAVRVRYWKWLEDFLLNEFKDEQPQSYDKLLESVRDVIDFEIAKGLPDGGSDG
ncbi:hypothetical protein [Mesorhizobium sp. M0040]|uniref:HTH domain-containing protein n=1 Tax=Mesorhizobium sp. M0040 TaxID=2956855 RepID=UPI00333A5D9A